MQHMINSMSIDVSICGDNVCIRGRVRSLGALLLGKGLARWFRKEQIVF